MRRARRAAAVLFGCALVACGTRGAAPADPLRNQLPAREPALPVIPGVPAVVAPAPPIELPPTGMDVVLDVTLAGDVLLGGRVVREAELDPLLMRLAAADPQRQLVIQVDGRVRHGVVVPLMQRARAAGFTRLALATRPVMVDPGARIQFRARSLLGREPGGTELPPGWSW